MPCGRTPAAAHSANSFTCVPDESPRDTNRVTARAMRANASAACCARATPAGSPGGPTAQNRLATNGQRSSTWPARIRASRDGACVITTSRSPRAADWRICPEGPITVTTRAPVHSASTTSSAPDCCTVYVVPTRKGRGVLVQAASGGGSPERLARFAVDTIPMADGTWSPDRTREVVVLKGDLWLVDRRGAKRRLSETAAAESNPGWSGDGRTVFFTREGNAWALDVDGGAERQLTDVRRGPAPKAPPEPTGEGQVLRDA